MKSFVAFTHNNQNDTRMAIVNTNEIVSLSPVHNEPTNLYNEDGEIVETRENPSDTFVLVLKNGFKYYIKDTNEYHRLIDILLENPQD